MEKEYIKKMFKDKAWIAKYKEEDIGYGKGLMFHVNDEEPCRYITMYEDNLFDKSGNIIGRGDDGCWYSFPAEKLDENILWQYKEFCFNKKTFPKLRNKDIKKLFESEVIMEKYSRKGGMCGRCLIFDVPNDGLRYVEVFEKEIFDERGRVICNCNGYWYRLPASRLMWNKTSYNEYVNHCMILEGFVSGHSFKRFSD